MARKRRGERPDGRIQVTYTDGTRPDGKPNRISFYGKTRAEAETKKAEYIERKKLGVSPLADTMTVSEWLDECAETYGTTQATVSLYKRMARDLGQVRLKDVREINCLESLGKCAGMSKGLVSSYRTFMRETFRRAIKNKLIADNPAEDIVLPDATSGTHRMLEPWEIQAIIGTKLRTPASVAAIIMLMCGLRRGEVMALRRDCVDRENRVIRVRAIRSRATGVEGIKEGSKTSAGIRDVPACQLVLDAASALPNDHELLLGCEYTIGKFKTVFANYLKDLSAECGRTICFRTHDLRHTYASLLYDAGVDVKSAQTFLGHSSVKMTMDIYTHLSESKKSTSADRLLQHLDMLTGSKNE